jgi:RIO kinase 1
LHDAAFEHFLDEGLIERVLRPIKSGKEASVHLCRANPRTTGVELAALKLYHPLDRRDFRDETMYRDGEWIKERRVRVALEKKTRFGREVQGAIWVSREWETLHKLAAAGARVPRPIEATDDAILMSYIGDADAAAPQLHLYRPDDLAEAESLLAQILGTIELMLYHDVVHGDLSAFNVLIWEGEVTVIDFPQAVDTKKNRHARAFLDRDVQRICDHFERIGIRSHADRAAADLWTAWEFAELVPEELRGVGLQSLVPSDPERRNGIPT